jgi:hypothetical protein
MYIPRFDQVSSLIMLATASNCLLAFVQDASAQVRREPVVTSTISRNTASVENALFGPDGYFLIAGGVVLHGQADFILEQNGQDSPIAASTVTPVAEPNGKIALQSGGKLYQLAMPAGLACPLARFTQRDGLIAYTILKFMTDSSPRALQRAGLVRHRLAKEFDGTGFEKLLHAADFAATEALPDGTGRALASAINDQNGIGAFVLTASDTGDRKIGSYVNTDLQVTYKAYLVASTDAVETAGVPLRYYWLLDSNWTPGVFSVEALAQNWPANATLTDWTAPNAQPTQYDIVNFYQTAGVFRQLHTASPDAFARFTDQACRP